jgi:hypothetical protein
MALRGATGIVVLSACSGLAGCPKDDIVFEDVVDVDALGDLDRDNGLFRQARGLVGTDSPTLAGSANLAGTTVEELSSRADGFHTTRTSWALVGDAETYEAFFVDADEYLDSQSFLGLDILDATPDGTVWRYTAPGVRLLPGAYKHVQLRSGNVFDGFSAVQAGFDLAIRDGVKVVPVRFWRFVREDNAEGPDVTAENTRQWLDGARILPQPGTIRQYEGGEPFTFFNTFLHRWQADGTPADQVVDSVYMQCPIAPEDGRYRFQFRFHSFSDVPVDEGYVDSLFLRGGKCFGWAPFFEMKEVVRLAHPEVEIPDPEGVLVEVFLVRGSGRNCEESTAGISVENDVALVMDNIDSFRGQFPHHWVLAHEMGHVLGHPDIDSPGNLMNDNLEAVGDELTDEQCAGFDHAGL